MGFLENFEYIFLPEFSFTVAFIGRAYKRLTNIVRRLLSVLSLPVCVRLCRLLLRGARGFPSFAAPLFPWHTLQWPIPFPQKRRATSDSLLWISVCGTTYLISSSFCSYQPLTTSIAIEFYVGHHLCHRPKNFSLLLRLLLLRGDISIAVSLRFQSIRLPLTHTVKTLSPLIS